MAQAPKTLRVHWERCEIRSPSGKASTEMIPAIQLPEALFGGDYGGMVDMIIDNIAGEYVLVRLGPGDVAATPMQADPRVGHGPVHPAGGWLYRWPDRGGRLEYLATLGGAGLA